MANKLTLAGTWKILKESITGFNNHKIFKLAASLAYYTVFSMGPMLICIIFLANLFYGREAVEGQVFGQIKGFVGENAAAQIQDIIRNASLTGKGPIAATIGFATLLIGATSVFAEIQDSINMIWNLKTKSERGWLKMLMNRLLSFSIVVSLGFLLLVSLIINAVIEAVMGRLQAMFPDNTVILIYVVNLVVTLFVTALLFAIIFKVLPDARIRWKDIGIGAIVTAVLFMIGKFGITFYIGSSNMGTTYGAAGSIVVLLVWVYFSAIILYFGAEFTRVYAALHGQIIHPNQYAVWIKEVEVEQGTESLQQNEKKKMAERENPKPGTKVK
jgi:membrane protein